MARYYRKLQKISESFFVNIPKNWIKNFKLDKNSTVSIDIRTDGSLIVYPKMKEGELKDELVLQASRSIPREIVKNALSGLETIIVVSDEEIDKKLRNDIDFFIDGLPNTDIIEETKHKIVIQNFGFKKIPTRKLIQRLLYIVSDMFVNVKENHPKELKRNFSQLRKFYFMLVTHIRTYLRTGIYVSEDKDFTPVEAMDFRMFCEKIEQIGVILKDLKINNKVEVLFTIIEQYYLDVSKAYLKNNLDLAYELWFKRDLVIDQAKDLMNELDYNEIDSLNDMLMITHACKDMVALI
ncbi:MAG: AbrB/MazE/SpoVT family DNA-binding domain-containing protein [Promethearchaeota archaeon]